MNSEQSQETTSTTVFTKYPETKITRESIAESFGANIPPEHHLGVNVLAENYCTIRELSKATALTIQVHLSEESLIEFYGCIPDADSVIAEWQCEHKLGVFDQHGQTNREQT